MSKNLNDSMIEKDYDPTGANCAGRSASAIDPCAGVAHTQYIYNENNQLTKIYLHDTGFLFQYRYDPLGRRIMKRRYRYTPDGGTYILNEWYAYDGDDVVADYSTGEYSSGGPRPDAELVKSYLILSS